MNPNTTEATPLLRPAPPPPPGVHQYQTTGNGLLNKSVEDAASSNASSTVSLNGEHKTNLWETFLHLAKGSIGCGLLGLPWAMSQLGVVGGVVAIFVIAVWTSYNCWVVVQLKRYMEKTAPNTVVAASTATTAGGGGGADNASDTSSKSNITYPDIGEWAYGTRFQNYTTACICVQQMAVCTVFVSFMGENLLAVFNRLSFLPDVSHTAVISMILPFVLGLSFVPSLKTLAGASVAGLLLLVCSLVALFTIVGKEWQDRPDTLPEVNPPQIPLALCAILYSYEGICIILPVESAMQEPKYFGPLFLGTMVLVACTLATVAVLCVNAFGDVTSGSVTAFLMEVYHGESDLSAIIMFANVAVSLSVLMTYPLQLFPAIELLGPIFQQNKYLSKFFQQGNAVVDDDDKDLSGFEPLPPISENEVAKIEALPDEHNYETNLDDEFPPPRSEDAVSLSGVSSVSGSIFPQMIMPGDSPQLRATLVLFTYIVAIVVPNVQALISLAGALAGSSIALLIPPVLELAYIEFLEHLEEQRPILAASPLTSKLMVPPASPHLARLNSLSAKKKKRKSYKYWKERVKCHVNFGLGLLFLLIGTYFSLVDIVRIYLGTKQQ